MADQPTQSKHPWRATARTVFAASVALLSLLPTVAAVAHVDTIAVVAQTLAVTGTVTRVLAIPGVNVWLRTWLPWLAADAPTPAPPQDSTPGTAGGARVT